MEPSNGGNGIIQAKEEWQRRRQNRDAEGDTTSRTTPDDAIANLRNHGRASRHGGRAWQNLAAATRSGDNEENLGSVDFLSSIKHTWFLEQLEEDDDDDDDDDEKEGKADLDSTVETTNEDIILEVDAERHLHTAPGAYAIEGPNLPEPARSIIDDDGSDENVAAADEEDSGAVVASSEDIQHDNGLYGYLVRAELVANNSHRTHGRDETTTTTAVAQPLDLWRVKRRAAVGALLVVMLFAAITVPTTVAIRSRESNNSNNSNGEVSTQKEQTTTTILSPTSTPSSRTMVPSEDTKMFLSNMPSNPPSPLPLECADSEAYFDGWIEQAMFGIICTVSNPLDIRTPGTSANQAFLRMIDETEGNPLIAFTREELIQRYVMAVFFFGSNGPLWDYCTPNPISSSCPFDEGDRFLSFAPACDWFNVTCTDANSNDEDDSANDISMLWFENNNLGNGTIPTELGVLTSLRRLVLSGGSYTGKIPAQLFNLGTLQLLDLSNNHLTGEIPAKINSLLSLQYLVLNGNSMSGEIPFSLSLMKNLTSLAFGRNTQLGGIMDPSFGRLSQLEALDVAGNAFTGPMPAFLGYLTRLTTLVLFDNAFTGNFDVLGRLSNLKQLYLHSNDFSGTMPTSVCDLRATGNLVDLWADCGGINPKVQCDQPECCTVCFS